MDGRRLLLIIGVIIFIIIISIAIFKVDWGGGNKPIQDAFKEVNISDYSDTNTQVRMSVRGPVNSDQEHQDLKITVGRSETIGQLLQGYQGNITRTQQTANNSASYKIFLSALHNAEFTKTQTPERDLQYDGACPTGSRYTFEFINAGTDAPKSTWATTCSKKDGTFGGDVSMVRNLFRDQLPKEQFEALTDHTDF